MKRKQKKEKKRKKREKRRLEALAAAAEEVENSVLEVEVRPGLVGAELRRVGLGEPWGSRAGAGGSSPAGVREAGVGQLHRSC